MRTRDRRDHAVHRSDRSLAAMKEGVSHETPETEVAHRPPARFA